MRAPNPLLRVLFALFGFTSVHWAAGRWRRALAWNAAAVASILLIWHLNPLWLVPLSVGHLVDAALITPARERSTGGYAIAALIAFCCGMIFSTVVRGAWVEAFKIPSGAMIPALQIGDHIFVDKTVRQPKRGDVTLFAYPKEPDKDFVKRIVAVGGDTIEIRDDQLVINGQPVPRRHVDEDCRYQEYRDDEDRWEERRCDAWDETLDGRTWRVLYDRGGSPHSWAPVTVPPGHSFAMGDNRDNSHDSRYWGFVPPENIKGVARKVWWSSGPDGVRWDRMNRPIR